MKRLLFTAGTMAALVLASCSNDEINNLSPTTQGLIRYNAVMNSSTRANSLFESNSYPAAFYVYALNNEGNTYISGDKVEISTTGQCTYDQRYWPKGYTLDFMAYSGHDYIDADAKSVIFNKVTEDGTDYTKKLVLTNIAITPWASKQDDMLYAITQGETGKDEKGDEKDVTLNFRHALAQLNFRFVNNNENKMRVYVDEVRICNIYNTATEVVYTDASTIDQYTEGSADNFFTGKTLCSWPTSTTETDASHLGKIAVVTAHETGSNTMVNGAFASLTTLTPLKVTATPSQLYSDPAVEFDVNDYVDPYLDTENDYILDFYYKDEKIKNNTSADRYTATKDLYWDAEKQLEVDKASLTRGLGLPVVENPEGVAESDIIDMTADQPDITVAYNYFHKLLVETGDWSDWSADDIYAYFRQLGRYLQNLKDRIVMTDEQKAERYAEYVEDLANAKEYRKDNAVYVIPQSTTPGKVSKTAHTVGEASGSYNQLKDVTGMYFLIKCSIQNIADKEAGVQDDDIYLHGSADKTAYVYVPLRAEDYDIATEKHGDGETTDTYIKGWKAGRKYIYTFFFGENGSNGGLPVTDPENPGVDPDPDPDDDSVIDENDPTLRLITYSVSSISVDDYQTEAKDDVDVTFDKTKDNATTTE